MVSFNMLHLGISLYHAPKHMAEGGGLVSVISMLSSMYNEPRCLAGLVNVNQHMRLDKEMYIELFIERHYIPSFM